MPAKPRRPLRNGTPAFVGGNAQVGTTVALQPRSGDEPPARREPKHIGHVDDGRRARVLDTVAHLMYVLADHLLVDHQLVVVGTVAVVGVVATGVVVVIVVVAARRVHIALGLLLAMHRLLRLELFVFFLLLQFVLVRLLLVLLFVLFYLFFVFLRSLVFLQLLLVLHADVMLSHVTQRLDLIFLVSTLGLDELVLQSARFRAQVSTNAVERTLGRGGGRQRRGCRRRRGVAIANSAEEVRCGGGRGSHCGVLLLLLLRQRMQPHGGALFLLEKQAKLLLKKVRK
mmetsp:Transcript_30740/g.75056  ORF Transcript_30740/g.75056 Transcript_30740/m.75056 type:complete len:285 (-) Transcript_30740:1658-2512(-)